MNANLPVSCIVLGILATVVAGPVLATPNCYQVQGIDPCSIHCGQECGGEAGHPRTDWGACDDDEKLFRVIWSCGCTSPWTYCHCPACDCLSGGCFPAGTPIKMADGTTKMIESIQIGDRVLSYDEGSAALVDGAVTTVFQPRVVESCFVINEAIYATESQPVLCHGAWIEVGSLKLGDSLTNPDGVPVPITSLRRLDKKTTVYNLSVSGVGTYVANGVIVHNKELPYTIYPGE